MNDLRNDKDELAERLAVTSDLVAEQSDVLTVSTAADESDLEMQPAVSGSDAWGVYHWSKSAGKGFITCFDLPPLAEGEVYQAWFATAGRSRCLRGRSARPRMVDASTRCSQPGRWTGRRASV